MSDLITPFVDAWVNNVFGDSFIAGIFFILFFTIWGVKNGWGLDMFIIAIVPLVFIMSLPISGGVLSELRIILLIGLGIIITIGMSRFTSR